MLQINYSKEDKIEKKKKYIKEIIFNFFYSKQFIVNGQKTKGKIIFECRKKMQIEEFVMWQLKRKKNKFYIIRIELKTIKGKILY